MQEESHLKAKVKAVGAANVYLVTDPDREGEAINWHLCQVLGLDPRTAKRITFQEITEKAIKAALASPRRLDMPLAKLKAARPNSCSLAGLGSEVSLALEAQKALQAEGVANRVVSMPLWELFEKHNKVYREQVLPPTVRKRVSIEAGRPLAGLSTPPTRVLA